MAEIALPNDLASAHATILELHAHYHTLRGEYGDIKHRLDQMCRHLYGRRSEQVDPAQLQLAFAALEAEHAALAPVPAAATAEPSERAPRSRPGHGRKPLPKDLHRERRVIEPSDDDLVCACCGGAKVKIGEETSEQLEYAPASFKVIETVRPKHACSKCKDGVAVALAPRSPISKGLAASGLLAHMIVSKYADHVPLSRLTTIFKRLRIDISRQTLGGWVENVFLLLAAVEAAQWRSVLSSEILGADETPVNVLELGRKQCARGYLWCYIGDQAEVVFDFSMGRGSDSPLRALPEYGKGVIVSDGYIVYDELGRQKPDVVRGGCTAHARRKVYEAKDVDPDRALILLALRRS